MYKNIRKLIKNKSRSNVLMKTLPLAVATLIIISTISWLVFVKNEDANRHDSIKSKPESSISNKNTQQVVLQDAKSTAESTNTSKSNSSLPSTHQKTITQSTQQAPTTAVTPTPNPYITHNGSLVIDPSSMNLVFQLNKSTGGVFRVTSSNGKPLTEVNIVSNPPALTIACCGISGGLWFGTIYSTYEDGVGGSGVIQLSAKDALEGTYSGSFNIQWSFIP